MSEVVLVTGGAGYIGSHTVNSLIQNNFKVIVLDNLSTGFKDSLNEQNIQFVEGDIRNKELLVETFKKYRVTCVIHFAAKLIVSESVIAPYDYYENNVVGTLTLLQAMRDCGVQRIVFSSTAAVYGDAHTETNSRFHLKVESQSVSILDRVSQKQSLVSEKSPTAPLNSYGSSKLMVEKIIEHGAQAYQLNYIILRYFNVAGASLDGRNGQRTRNATHLIKVAAETALGLRAQMSVFGNDYSTPDGTCIRDYIHVQDLADIHTEALKYLIQTQQSHILNCGYGAGFSVLDVLKTFETKLGWKVPYSIAPRREGDAVSLVADNTQLLKTLNWKPRYNDLELICRTALDWQKNISFLK